ncbi:hypothetical protein AVEN_79516-1 [Araneus ventricosus]|uniref:Uncharacterized protein n=1 Tax=Araneus ventricosus TaxID=182803 RepID=A0A4Y2GGM7_ARAVE|nr:hypothetical protein AVEN_79516-1 [Araneus ventricosus]
MQEKHLAQITRTITLVQINNTNRQQFTGNNSNSAFRFRSRNSQQITNNDSNSTFSSAQPIGFPARTEDETPKTFLESVRTPFIYPFSTGCYVTWKYLAHSSISSSNGDIEEMIADSGIFAMSPSFQNGCQVCCHGQESKPCRCWSFQAYPVKLSS